MYISAMERLITVVQQLSLARDLDTIMAIVRTAARDLTGADGATFILREGDNCFYADENAIAPLWKGKRFPMSRCISGWAMTHRRAAVVEDIYRDPRIPVDAYEPTFVKSLLVVPIRTLDPIGAIGNYWAAHHVPSAEEVKLLQALADTTAVAIENVRLCSDLERRVRERTSELETANRDLDDFCHSVSHDLRAPVRAIAGFCGLITKDHASRIDAEMQRKLSVINDEAARMGRLIEDLLVFSRLGRKALKPVELDMDALAERALERLRLDQDDGRAVVKIGTLPNALGDMTLLDQVWTNLLSNALKFSAKQAEPVIEVDGRDTGAEIEYSVRDNGAGFDPQYADRLFQTFQRLHHQNDFPGTGVGLALVNRIVRRHGGRVSAEGAVGAGATFRFTLPKAITPAASLLR
jgi:signal transduction histidine kinase